MTGATYVEPERTLPVVDDCDVLVVGGGSAGIAAAVAAAREGADTVLVERYGSLGGMATGGLVILLLTLDDGRGTTVVRGICEEVVRRLDAAGMAVHALRAGDRLRRRRARGHYRRWGLVWGRDPHRVRNSVAYCPEAFRQIANDLLGEAGARLRLHSLVAAPIVEDGRVAGVVTESKSGRRAHRAAVVVDASGDGDVYAGAGAPFDLEAVHPWLWFRMGNVETPDDAMEARPGASSRPSAAASSAPRRGPDADAVGIADGVDRKIDPTAPDDLTFAEVECRRRVMEVVERLRAEEPALRGRLPHGRRLAARHHESRRLHGRYVMSRDDAAVLRRRHRGHRRLGALRADATRSRTAACCRQHARPARGRALHLRRPPRPPGDEGDPAVLRHRRGRRRRRRDRCDRGIAPHELTRPRSRRASSGAGDRAPPGACAVHPESEGAR